MKIPRTPEHALRVGGLAYGSTRQRKAKCVLLFCLETVAPISVNPLFVFIILGGSEHAIPGSDAPYRLALRCGTLEPCREPTSNRGS